MSKDISPIKFTGRGPRRLLSDRQVHEARRMHRSGVKVEQICIDLGISRQTAYQALAGRGPYKGI